jgi:hypothetical protein
MTFEQQGDRAGRLRLRHHRFRSVRAGTTTSPESFIAYITGSVRTRPETTPCNRRPIKDRIDRADGGAGMRAQSNHAAGYRDDGQGREEQSSHQAEGRSGH